MFKSHFKNAIYITLVAVCIVGCANYVSAWTAPSGVAPERNVDGPITISTANQNKDGSMALGGLAVLGNTIFTSPVKIESGNPGEGKVLVSDEDGNARWETYETALSLAKKYDCPAGSTLTTYGGRTFCGYTRVTGGYGYCDSFGSSYDPMISCIDIGHGRNHGISPYWNGCLAWEGEKNYGGQGAQFTCEKLMYQPKTAEQCTNPNAIIGSITDTAISPNPIVTCSILTPYTYNYCSEGVLQGGRCFRASRWVDTYTPALTASATSTECMEGWTKYQGVCI